MRTFKIATAAVFLLSSASMSGVRPRCVTRGGRRGGGGGGRGWWVRADAAADAAAAGRAGRRERGGIGEDGGQHHHFGNRDGSALSGNGPGGAAAALKWGSGVKPKRRKIDEPQPRRWDVVTRRMRLSERCLWLEAPNHDFWGHGVMVMSCRATVRRFKRSRATTRRRRSSSSSSSRSVGGAGGACASGRGGGGGTYPIDGLERRAHVAQRLDALHTAPVCGPVECCHAALRCKARRRRRRRGARRRIIISSSSSRRRRTPTTTSARGGREAREIGSERENSLRGGG